MNKYKKISYSSKKEWHKIRSLGVGGSDASTIMNVNEYMNTVDLWKLKTGREQRKDISNEKAVKRGVESEKYLFELFKINNPEFNPTIEKDTLQSVENQFMVANVDGLIEHEEYGKGVLEIKTTTIFKYDQFIANWKNNIPISYYWQIQHYLSVTDRSYAILFADLYFQYRDEHVLKKIYIEKDEEDIELLIQKEKEFWKCVVDDKEPSYIKKLII